MTRNESNERKPIMSFSGRWLPEFQPDSSVSVCGLNVERLRRAMASDEEMFRLLWPDENGLELAAERIAAAYDRLTDEDGQA